nr:ribosomal protein S16 [Cephalotaxus hainanensis]
MIRIRLKRCGRKQQVSKRRKSSSVQELCFYDPMNKKETRLIYGAIVNFLELGAQPIETVHGIFLKAKIYRFKRALELKKKGR